MAAAEAKEEARLGSVLAGFLREWLCFFPLRSVGRVVRTTLRP